MTSTSARGAASATDGTGHADLAQASRFLLATGTEPAVRWAVFPSRARPRLLVPLDERRAAAAAIRDYARHARRANRLRGWALATIIRAGLPVALTGARLLAVDAAAAAELTALLSELAGEPVVPAVHLGTVKRANSKPVLYLLAADGRLVGIGKLGTTPLARRLLETEHDALELLARDCPAMLEAPAPAHRVTWRQMPLYVQSPLPLREAKHAPPIADVVPAVTALSQLGQRQDVLAASAWWRAIRTAVAAPAGAEVAGLVAAVEAAHGGQQMAFGAAHGDLSPWNVARRNGHLLLWDWERFQPAAPVGMDLLHYLLWSRVGRVDAEEAVRAMVAEAPRILAGCGVTDRRQQQATIAAYAVSMSLRYLGESAQPGPQPRAVAAALTRAVGVAPDAGGERMVAG
jgi:hypothetical protein